LFFRAQRRRDLGSASDFGALALIERRAISYHILT
jgi:hypothetical protein